MKRVEVLGPGCPKCRKTEELIVEELKDAGLEVEIEHITALDAIVDRGVMMTPAVIIDGELMIEGKVPSAEQVRSWLG